MNQNLKVLQSNAPIGAMKCNFRPCKKLLQTDQQQLYFQETKYENHFLVKYSIVKINEYEYNCLIAIS